MVSIRVDFREDPTVGQISQTNGLINYFHWLASQNLVEQRHDVGSTEPDASMTDEVINTGGSIRPMY